MLNVECVVKIIINIIGIVDVTSLIINVFFIMKALVNLLFDFLHHNRTHVGGKYYTKENLRCNHRIQRR